MIQSENLKNSDRQIYSHTGLRGIAAMIVFLFHLNGPQYHWDFDHRVTQFFYAGAYSVDLFFILSGFILNWVYLSQTEAPIQWATYLKARVARIMPLYYLTLALCLPIPLYSLLKHGLAYVGHDYPMVFVSNLFMVSGIIDGWHVSMNAPAWSISVEFFCYLALFPILVSIYKFLVSKRYGFAVSLLFVALNIRLLVLCYRTQPIPIFHWQWDSHWLARGVFGFTAGFFLCSKYRAASIRKPSVAVINLIVLGSIVVFILTRIDYLPIHLFLYALPFLVYFTAFDKGLSAYFLKLNPLQWLGERSYSIYLWHIPVMGFCFPILEWMNVRFFKGSNLSLIKYLSLVAIVLLISELSYRYFEVPCRDYIRRLGRKHNGYPSLAVPRI